MARKLYEKDKTTLTSLIQKLEKWQNRPAVVKALKEKSAEYEIMKAQSLLIAVEARLREGERAV